MSSLRFTFSAQLIYPFHTYGHRSPTTSNRPLLLALIIFRNMTWQISSLSPAFVLVWMATRKSNQRNHHPVSLPHSCILFLYSPLSSSSIRNDGRSLGNLWRLFSQRSASIRKKCHGIRNGGNVLWSMLILLPIAKSIVVWSLQSFKSIWCYPI